ncbi:hypothetical protein BJ138DRAFT_1107518 [Hygrophoropsis aurantiaca]|uniref:Uncharacterized protein n=1 Tax=Hygrophoropsis aurantiaca TaxID=72124 RepID=A0ACB7ZRZ3_9AGAM|nr:hypothetical protein BJ138DRAFT_1107518 [Hygrophoropsis aurantiaca]
MRDAGAVEEAMFCQTTLPMAVPMDWTRWGAMRKRFPQSTIVENECSGPLKLPTMFGRKFAYLRPKNVDFPVQKSRIWDPAVSIFHKSLSVFAYFEGRVAWSPRDMGGSETPSEMSHANVQPFSDSDFVPLIENNYQRIWKCVSRYGPTRKELAQSRTHNLVSELVALVALDVARTLALSQDFDEFAVEKRVVQIRPKFALHHVLAARDQKIKPSEASADYSHFSTRNITHFNPLELGAFVIMRNIAREYIGEEGCK